MSNPKSSALKVTVTLSVLLLLASSAGAQERYGQPVPSSRQIGAVESYDPPADVTTAAERLLKSSEGLLDSLKHNPVLSSTERENLIFRAKHLSENARSVADLADVGPSAADRLERALGRVDEYADQFDELVAAVENVRFLRRPHEAFLAALDGMHASLAAAAEALAQAKTKTKTKPRSKGKAKGKKVK